MIKIMAKDNAGDGQPLLNPNKIHHKSGSLCPPIFHRTLENIGNSGKWSIPVKFWKSLIDLLPGFFDGFKDLFPFLPQSLEPFKLPIFAESPPFSHETLKER
jgi:hypothetical protein